MNILEAPAKFISQVGDLFWPKNEHERRSQIAAAVIILAGLVRIKNK